MRRLVLPVLVSMWAATSAHRVAAAPAGTAAASAASAWVAESASPRPGQVHDPKDAPLTAKCGGGVDAGLVRVANEVAEVLAIRGELPDAQEIEWRMRKAGSPYVWPRTWGAHVSGTLDRTALVKDVGKWLGPNAPRLRCGAATVRIGSGAFAKESAVVIAVDPPADVAPIPTRAKVGAWLDLDATLLRGTGGQVVLLPPTGAPKTILSSSGLGAKGLEHVKARFVVAKPGRHVVQVLAEDGNGPRPVLEVEVWAGVEPPTAPPSSAVPGESAGDGVTDPVEALLRRVNGARAAEGQAPLTRDPNLEKAAQAHSNAMMKARLLGHDVGDGDPATRVAETGGTWKLVGENVAKAKTERAAHRAIYASPSHRSNMLEGRFKKIGIAIAADPKTGDLWITQLFGG